MIKITNTQQQLLNLLKASLFNNSDQKTEFGTDTESIIALARQHCIIPLIYKELKQNSGEAAASLIRGEVISGIIHNDRMLTAQTEILQIFEKLEIKCAVLKGTSVAVNYPDPNERILGDIDILICKSDIAKAGDGLSGIGYHLCGGEHPYHVNYDKGDVHVELHFAVSEIPDNTFGKAAEKYLSDVLDKIKYEHIGTHKFPVLSLKHQLLSLLMHMEHHMISGGIGLRQLCDWAVTIDKYRDKIDNETIKMLNDCGLLVYAKIITKSCVNYIGLQDHILCNGVTTNDTLLMIEEILMSGNINKHDINRNLSSTFISEINHNKYKRNIIILYIQTINKRANTELPITKRMPILLPLFWIYYPIRRCILTVTGKKNMFNILELFKNIKRRKKLYDKLKIYK